MNFVYASIDDASSVPATMAFGGPFGATIAIAGDAFSSNSLPPITATVMMASALAAQRLFFTVNLVKPLAVLPQLPSAVTSSFGTIDDVSVTTFEPPQRGNTSVRITVSVALPPANIVHATVPTTLALRFPREVLAAAPTCGRLLLPPRGLEFAVTLSPLKPQVLGSSGAAAVSSTSVATGATSAFLGNPVVASMQSTISALTSLSVCVFSDVDQLDSNASPFGYGIGDPVGQYYRGAIWGFIGAVATSSAALGLATCIGAARIMQKKKLQGGISFRRSFLKVAAVTHFPGIVVIPFLVCFQGALISATSLVRLGLSTSDIALAAAGVLTSAAGIVIGYAVAKPWFQCTVGDRKRETPLEFEAKIPYLDNVLAYVEWNEEWADTSVTNFKKRYMNMFDGFVVPWYPILELGNTAVQGMVLGVRANSTTSCVIQSVLLFLLSGASLIVSVRLRPAGAHFDQHCLVGGKALILLTSLLVLMESLGVSGFDSAVQWISIMNSMVANFQTLVMVLLSSLTAARYVKRHGLLGKLKVADDQSDLRSVMLLEQAMIDIGTENDAPLRLEDGGLVEQPEDGAVDSIDLVVISSSDLSDRESKREEPQPITTEEDRSPTQAAQDEPHHLIDEQEVEEKDDEEAALAVAAETLNWDPTSGFDMTEEQLGALPLKQRLIIQRLIRKRKRLVRHIQEGLSGGGMNSSSSTAAPRSVAGGRSRAVSVLRMRRGTRGGQTDRLDDDHQASSFRSIQQQVSLEAVMGAASGKEEPSAASGHAEEHTIL